VSEHPTVAPSIREFGGFDAGGVEDPRVVRIDDLFYITYCARAVPEYPYRKLDMRRDDIPATGVTWTKNYRRGALLTSTDLKTFEKRGPITPEGRFDANLALFPENIGGRFALLHRPSDGMPCSEPRNKAGVSIAFSDNLQTWHDDQPLLRPEFPWENTKVGGSNPPIKTEEGWLMLYHGVESTIKNGRPTWPMVYRVGVALLDFEDPTRVIARAPDYIMEPEAPFEREGTVKNVVFPTGGVVLDDELFIYYGGADTVCCVATVKLKELIDFVLCYRR